MAIETNRVTYEGEAASKSAGLREQEQYETSHKVAAGGIGLAALLGLVSLVLSVLGLVNVAPMYMAGISAICLGVALLLAGGFSMEWFNAPREHFFYEGEGAMSTEVMSGVGGIVLGILALLGIASDILLPVAVLGIGVALFMSSWVSASHFSGIKCLTGLTGIVLGILAITGVAPLALTLVGFLTLGFGILFSGSVTGARYMYAAQGA
jgi:hypothetical protein